MNTDSIEDQVITHAPSQPVNIPKRRCTCCKSCSQHQYREPESTRPIELEELNQNLKILVLDLDETLVHCSFHPPEYYHECVTINIDGVEYEVYVQERPFLADFLADVMKNFYVVIFTASLSQYANPIIDLICPTLPPQQRLFRESCTFVDGVYVKDLTIFHTPLEQVIIVDNNPFSFLLHPANAILSDTWEGDTNDTQLNSLILPILHQCIPANDIKEVLSKIPK